LLPEKKTFRVKGKMRKVYRASAAALYVGRRGTGGGREGNQEKKGTKDQKKKALRTRDKGKSGGQGGGKSF